MYKNLLLLYLLSFSLVGLSQEWSQVQHFANLDIGAQDWLGHNMDIQGDQLIVGSPRNDLDANGENSITFAGAAYIYNLGTDGNWTQTAKLVAPDRSLTNEFGNDVAIYGEYAIVGCTKQTLDENGENAFLGAGAAYFYTKNAGVWEFTQKIVAPDRYYDDDFGTTVEIEGEFVFISAPFEDEDENGENATQNAGSTYIFKINESGNLDFLQKILASDRDLHNNFGISFDTDEDLLIVGSRSRTDFEGENNLIAAGAAYIFERQEDDTWAELQKITASDREEQDRFSDAVAVEGDYILVGAWAEDQEESGMFDFPGSGSVYAFEKMEDDSWEEIQKIKPSDLYNAIYFGGKVSMSGGYALVNSWGSTGTGTYLTYEQVYVLKYNGSAWTQIQILSADDQEEENYFGSSVAIDGANIVIGSMNDEFTYEGEDYSDSGSLYSFFTSEVTGVSELSDDEGLIAFPNPFEKEFYLSFNDHSKVNCLEVKNATGQLIHRVEDVESNTSKFNIDVSSGLLLIQVYYEDGTVEVKRVLKY